MSANETVLSTELNFAASGSKAGCGDNLVLSVASNTVADASVEEDEQSNATHLTIQLPDGMQGSTLSQQKLQDLILQLSQAGQIQLKEDSKIVIDLKFSDKSSQPAKTEKAPLRPSISLTNPRTVAQLTSSSEASRNVHIANQVPVKADPMSQDGIKVVRNVVALSSSHTPLTARHVQQQQQQPTYILVPAGQLSGSSDTQAYSSSNQWRTVSTGGGSVLRALGTNTVSSAVNLSTSDRSFIVLQQPVSGSGNNTSSNSFVISNSGGTTLVPLRQLSGATNLVSGNTLLTTSTNRIIGSNAGGDLFVTSGSIGVASRTHQGNLVTITTGPGAGSQRESSWQQYVKQFTKLGPCPICGDKISGYHYGIFCCESCKGFFKRTVQNAKRYTCHHPNTSSLCEINVTSRKKCPACRFLKCVDKGMRIEAIRSDRTRGGRSMYPGSRYLRQIAARVGPRTSGVNSLDGNDQNILLGNRSVLDESDQLACAVIGLSGAHHSFGPDGLPSSMDAGGGVYLDPAVLGSHGDDDDDDDGDEMDHSGMDQSLLEYTGTLGSTSLNNSGVGGAGATSTPYVGRQVVLNTGSDNTVRPRTELPKIINDILLVEESIEAEPEDALEIDSGNTPPGVSIPEGVSEDEAAVYRALLNLADQRLYRTVRWSRALPDFAQLDTDDQILLLQNCWADLLCLDCCWRSLPTPTEIRLTSSKCINLEAARELGAEEIVERMLQLTQYLTQLQLDVVEYACLKVIVLMQPDLKNLKASNHVRSYQETVRRLLADYITTSSSGTRDKFSRLLSRIPELQVTSQTARLMLVDLDLSAYLSSNSLLMELLRSDIQRYAPGANTAEEPIVVSTGTGNIPSADVNECKSASIECEQSVQDITRTSDGPRSEELDNFPNPAVETDEATRNLPKNATPRSDETQLLNNVAEVVDTEAQPDDT
ncbi:Nuclear receptor subfamily 5 group A member 3 [Fasciola gigantica]|uniref:Nuclear receptor subfamily 5 group A member 3 n=1 Tax=Fasciola gigantica TaxID=46835 RepID=A0A504YXW2_FASGI|nr:Nuclear receptor subfamily 5 group A member 3 [Fasciola gigantica]